nr:MULTISPECIES: ABC transporter permease [unclassified Arthrobacter]
MGSVVALITLLLVLLSGLTAGLGNQNTAAIKGLSSAGADTVAFGAPAGTDPKVSYTESSVTAGQLASWRATPGIDRAEPLGIAQTRVLGGSSANVALFGVEEGSVLPPDPVRDGELLLDSETAGLLSVEPGDDVRVGGEVLRVGAPVEPTYYSHTPVAWTSLASWQDASHAGSTTDAEDSPAATVIAAAGTDDAAAIADRTAGTVSTDVRGSFSGLGSYSSENGSLVMMQAFLYGISALVVVAFLAVWTIQRTRDIAVLKALGGSSAYLMRDALAQAGIIVASGAVVGGLLAVLAGTLAGSAAPFHLTLATALLPVAGIVLLGLAGSAAAVRSVTRVDPLTALGGN